MGAVIFTSTADGIRRTGAGIMFMDEEAHCVHSLAAHMHLTQQHACISFVSASLSYCCRVYASPAKLH